MVIKEICSSSKKWKEIRNSNVMDFIFSYYGQEKLELLDQAVPANFKKSEKNRLI